jgi:hypothetical protein
MAHDDCVAERRADMFVDPDVDRRTEPPLEGDERTILLGFLRWLRETLRE